MAYAHIGSARLAVERPRWLGTSHTLTAPCRFQPMRCNLLLGAVTTSGSCRDNLIESCDRGLMEWIASRTLTDLDSGEEVVVSLARPERVTDGEWSCAFRVEGTSAQSVHHAHGVDELQALLLAIEGLHYTLSRSDQRLTWLDDPGDTGIPRLTPTSFGLAFRQRVERILDEEIERFAHDASRPPRAERGKHDE